MRQLPLGVTASQPRIFSVTELTQRIRTALESGFDQVWVAGEISNCRLAPSGHWYFVLKDDGGQIAAVLFRGTARFIPFRPEEGMAVVVRGRVGLYEARGNLQLYVDALEPRGLGSLQMALEQLKQRLAAEGLFDSARKRPLPFLPRTIGIVTARRGAALHDMMVTLRHRCPGLRVVVRPALVQGKEAPADIVAALGELAELGNVEVVIVGRGGGSLEDLWAFNDERVARAIAAAPFPVVSAVGHEIDFTIADLVADHRAATPTAAATLVVPDRRDLLLGLARLLRSLRSGTARQLHRQQLQLTGLRRQLRDPRVSLRNLHLRVDELGERATRAMDRNLQRHSDTVRRFAERLHALSPLAVLQRGYAIARREADGTVVTDAATVSPGDELRLVLHRGDVLVSVR